MKIKTQEKYEGVKYNYLTAIKYVETQHGHAFWLFKCDCGKEVIRKLQGITGGRSISCGCIRREKKNKKQKIPKSEFIPNRGQEILFLISGLFNAYNSSAKKRKHSFNITIEHFSSLIFNNCFYCGSPPSQKLIGTSKNKGYEGILYNGVDRVINNEGYTEDNTVPCCGFCNRAKGIYSAEDMEEYIKRVKTNKNK
jgi:hypothetical protein